MAHRAFHSPGSLESMTALQVSHRFDLKTNVDGQQSPDSALGRRVLSHAMEAQKASAAAAEQLRQLQGKRGAATLAWLQRRQQERECEEQHQLESKYKVLPHLMTSDANPLLASGSPSASPAAGTAAAAAAASRAAAAAAAEGGAEASYFIGGSPGDAAAAAAAAHPLCRKRLLVRCDHLESGSLAPKEGGAADGGSAAGAHDDVLAAAAQAAALRQQEHEALLAQLAASYPHGIPKKMLSDLRALGITDVPGLGFGDRCSSGRLESVLAAR